MKELCFLLLDQCEIIICGDNMIRKENWIDVEIIHDNTEIKCMSTDMSVCRRCNLVLENDENESKLIMNYTLVQPFLGTLEDVFAIHNGLPSSDCICDCTTDEQRKKLKRSDAAMLIGLLKACNDVIQILSCKIIMNENETFSILITLDFPNLHAVETNNEDRRYITPIFTKKGKRKLLSSTLQLLLSLVRSDWDQLEQYLQQSSGQRNSRNLSFFPTKLTLGEIYKRLPASTVSLSHYNITNNPMKTNLAVKIENNKFDLLTDLPVDILEEKIAPFFRARELAAVRSTCSVMYQSLRGVVPGLKLRLHQHQINSLSWMRLRESCVLRSEMDYCQNTRNVDGFSLDNDLHRALSGGSTVVLIDRGNRDWSVRLDSVTGRELIPETDLIPARNVARGGLLCDDPGLGKTITVLALILQSSGITNETIVREIDEENPDYYQGCNDPIFEAYWEEEVVVDFRIPELLTLMNRFACENEYATFFPMKAIKQAISIDEYGSSFAAFESSVYEAIRQNAPTDDDRQRLSDSFADLLHQFKRHQMRGARRSFSNVNSKPNSRVAALIEEESKRKLLASLVPTCASLLVVPAVLVEHWKSQIEHHVNTGYCTDRKPLVFEFKKSTKEKHVQNAESLCEKNEVEPFLFLDMGGTRKLPPAKFLAKFKIVVTTTSRFMHEWEKGSFRDEISRDENDISTYRYSRDYLVGEDEEGACELLKIHWVRMIVDEGHSMGNGRLNSTIQFASWICAQRRWAMTGTPTKQNAAQLNQLRGLMLFLEHDLFTSRLEGDRFWKRNIARSWREGYLVSFFRLRSLLGFLMKRHTKRDIAELPPPAFRKTFIPMSFIEATTYNTLVCGVQTNLLVTSMNGKTSGLQDSLLHRSQAKNARLVLQNLRRVCTGWSRVVPTLQEKYYNETMDMADKFKIPDEAVKGIKDYLHRAVTEQLSDCACCRMRLSTLLIMSCCGGLICTECMDSSTSTCYLCDNVFDVDELQLFQPGFVLSWKENLEDHIKMASIPSSPKSVAEDTLQRDDVDGNQPNIRPPTSRRRRNKFGDGHTCEYDIYSADGKCVLCLEEHRFCNLLNKRQRCETCHRVAESCPEDESKSYYLVQRLLELHKQRQSLCSSSRYGDKKGHRPLKVIVFSQFRSSLNIIGSQLLNRFGTACVAEYFGRHRKEELHKFTHERSCFCLLLTKDGSEGLDLSFVTNIVFLEEIYDRSLQDQAVARAWRLGSSGRVEVETLVASNTVEESMGDFNDQYDDDDEPRASSGSSREQQRLKTLLQSLRLITDYHSFAQSETMGSDGKETERFHQNKRPLFPSSLPTTKFTDQSEPVRPKSAKRVKFSLL